MTLLLLALLGIEILYLILIIAVIFLLIIAIYRLLFHLKPSFLFNQKENNKISERTKYVQFNENQYYTRNLLIGFVLTLAFANILFSWTVPHQVEQYIVYDVFDDPTYEVTPPITIAHHKKKLIAPNVENTVASINNLMLEDFVTIQNNDTTTTIEDYPQNEGGELQPVESTPKVQPPKEIEETVFITAEQMPRFPGCEHLKITKAEKRKCAEEKLMAFIYQKIKYPRLAKENNVEGTAIVRFTVNTKGTIENIILLKDPGVGLGKEAYDVINSMNEMEEKWTPGKQRDKAVNVLYTIPIRFKLK